MKNTSRSLAVTALLLAGSVSVADDPPSDPSDFADSIRSGVNFSSSGDGVITGPGGTNVDSADFTPDTEHADQQTMIDEAESLSGDTDGLQDFETEWSKRLSGTSEYDTTQSTVFDITSGSLMSEGGTYEIDSHGCTIRRASNTSMVYLPDNPVGSRISGDAITIDEETCQPTFESRFGASCELLSTETNCVDADNTKKVKGEPKVYAYKSRTIPGTPWKSNMPTDDAYPWQFSNYRYSWSAGFGGGTQDLFNFDGSRLHTGFGIIDLDDFSECNNVSLFLDRPNNWRSDETHTNIFEWNDSRGRFFEDFASAPESSLSDLKHTNGGSFSTYKAGDKFIFHVDGTDMDGFNETKIGPNTLIFHIDPHSKQSSGSLSHTNRRTGINSAKIEGYCPTSKTVSNPESLPLCDGGSVGSDGLCKVPQSITLTPTIAQQELAPLWSEDDQSNVCWEAGSEASCTIETEEIDPAARAIAEGAFDQAVIDDALLEAMGDCTETTITDTISKDLSFTKSKECERPISPTISGCSLSRVVAMNANLQITEDRWEGSDRCELIEQRLNDHGGNCDYDLDFNTPNCVTTENGTELCSCSYVSSQGGDTSICPDATQRITPAMASSVGFLSDANAQMCVGYESEDSEGECAVGTESYGGVCIQNDLQFPDMTCKGYGALGDGISLGNKRSTSLTISDLICDAPSDAGCDTVVDGSGETQTVCGGMEVENTCTGILSDPQCTVTSTTCLDETGHALVCEDEDNCFDQLCFSEDVRVSCDVTESHEDEVVRTEMVCGESKYACFDGSCFSGEDEVNSDFGKSVALLTAAEGAGTHMECADDTDMSSCRVFGGEYSLCRRGAGPMKEVFNCCDVSTGSGTLNREDYMAAVVGAAAAYVAWDASSAATAVAAATTSIVSTAKAAISFLLPCYPEEYEIAMADETDSMIYLGKDCGKSISVGFSRICTRRDKHYCTFDSPLGRILMEQAALQLTDASGGLWRDYSNPQKNQAFCEGMTIEQLGSLDWSEINLDEWEHMLRTSNNLPPQECGTMNSGGCQDIQERDYDYDFEDMSPTGGPNDIAPL